MPAAASTPAWRMPPPSTLRARRASEIKSWLPEQFWKRRSWYKELSIPLDTIDELSISKYAELFKKAVKEWKVTPTTAAVILIQYPKRLKKRVYNFGSFDEEIMSSILKAFADGKITYDFILSAMKTSAELGMFVEAIIPNPVSDKEVEKEIELAREQMQKIPFIKKNNIQSIMMGILMKQLRGRISAKIIAEKVSRIKKDFANVR